MHQCEPVGCEDGGGDLVYARLQRSRDGEATGYTASELDKWAGVAKAWARGESPAGFPYVARAPAPKPRETYMLFISGAKLRNPAAAEALIARL